MVKFQKLTNQLLKIVLVTTAIIFLIGFPQFCNTKFTLTEVDVFEMIEEGYDPLLDAAKNNAKDKQYDQAKERLWQYFANRSDYEFYQLEGYSLDYYRNLADNDAHRNFTILGITRQLSNYSDSPMIIVNGREIANTNWHENPYPEDDEWIWLVSRLYWMDDISYTYMNLRGIGNTSDANRYAEIGIDMMTDFLLKEPMGSAWTWRTLECGIRLARIIRFGETLRKSPAFTPDVCYLWIKGILEHGRYLSQFHKIIFNWAIFESEGLLNVCAYLPEFSTVAKWEKIAWNTLEYAVPKSFYSDGGYKEQAINYHKEALTDLANALLIAQAHAYLTPSGELEILMKRGYEFLIHNTMPDGDIVTFGDSHKQKNQWFLQVGANLFPDDPNLRYFLYSGLPNASYPPPPTHASFSETGMYYSRSQWGDPDALYSMVDGSPPGKFYHHHQDFSNVALMAYGREILIDPGISSYTWDAESKYYASAYAHNIVIFDGVPQQNAKPASSRWSAGYLGSDVQITHDEYKFPLERDVLFVDFRDNFSDTFLQNSSNMTDKARYWIISDFWQGTDCHAVEQLWHMPDANMTYLSQGSMPISAELNGEMVGEKYSFNGMSTTFDESNVAVYSYGPWESYDIIHEGTPETCSQFYGNRADLEHQSGSTPATTLRTLGNTEGHRGWFSLFYPSADTPNISVNLENFSYQSIEYSSTDARFSIGNVFSVTSADSQELHIILRESTSPGIPIILNYFGLEIEFEGRQISLYFDKIASELTQIAAHDALSLKIQGDPWFWVEDNLLNISPDPDLDALTLNLSPSSQDSISNVKIGVNTLENYLAYVSENTLNLGGNILGGI